MTTTENRNGTMVTVNWKRLAMEDDAGDGHTYFYDAEGEDEDHCMWSGTWMECDGEIEIFDTSLFNF